MAQGPRHSELHEAGETVTGLTGPGSLVCVNCGYALAIEAIDALPECPVCGGAQFRRGSLFDTPTVDVGAVETSDEEPAWIDDARARLDSPVPHIAYEEDGELRTLPIAEGWTRIGRSSSADIQLDDPTVSRRHALIVRTPEGEVRALDDRSLNGLFLNGEAVEWSPLADGDQLDVGRYSLYVIEP